MSRARVGLWGIAGLMAVGFLGLVGSTQATTISRPPDITATVTAAVTPTRLPADSTASVTLALDGNVTRRPTCLGECASLHTIEVRLDPQVTVDTDGLPTCRVSDVKGYAPSWARRKCGRALIGSGETSETTQLPELPPFTTSSEQLLFNAGKGGKVLMYSYVPSLHLSGASLVGTIRRLMLRPNDGSAAAEVSFHFTFGKTWRFKGQTHSYLNGQCQTGTLKTQVTLGLTDGSVASDASPERCTKRSG
jgi:hypothetical protein